MYTLSELLSSFGSLVGWKGTTNLSSTESGLYYQEAHPLLTLRALEGIMPTNLGDQYDAFDEETSYAVGDIVSYNSAYYKCVVAGVVTDPSTSENWEEYSLFEEYLTSITEGSIKKVITRFVSEKLVGLETKNIIDRRTLFDGSGRKEATTENRGRLVGFEITPFRTNGIVTTLNKVGLQMIGNSGDVTLYLLHSSQPDAIASKTITISNSNGTFVWADLSWTLPYLSDSINAGGNWYVVYHQSELPDYMESINFGRDWSREPCGTCNKGDAYLYRLMQKYITFKPFYVAIDSGDFSFDSDDIVYTFGDNYGMNFQFTIGCDITDTLIAERFQFAHLIQLQVASDALREIAMNPEVAVNRTQYNVDRNKILYELDGNGQGIIGMKGDLEKAYKAVSIDLKGLDPICMGCHNKGIKFRSI